MLAQAWPDDLFLAIFGFLDTAELLTVARHLNRATCAAADEDVVWRALLTRKLRPMLDAFFDGEIPEPAIGRSWKEHFFELVSSWKRVAQERTGRLLVQVAQQKLSGRGPHETLSVLSLWKELWGARPSSTFGVYDVTSLADIHPGADLVIAEAAIARDATEIFEMAAHSDAAVRRLSRYAVPGLEAVTYDHETEAICRKWRRRGRLGCVAVVSALRDGLLAAFSTIQDGCPRRLSIKRDRRSSWRASRCTVA